MQGFGNDVYIGDWVPQARAQRIREAGVDPEYQQMMELNAYALAHPEAQADTMRKYYDAMNRWNAKGAQYQQEARDLTEQAMKNDARQLYENNRGPGSGGFGLAQQIAGSTLANQSQAILGARLGNLMMPAGNALETLDGMGLNVSDGLRRYAGTSDALNQFAYNPDNVFDAKSFGFGYKSDGIGGNDFGPVGYGGDGHQYAQEGFQEYNRNANNAANQRRWDTAMANATPGGRYQGASQEYTANVPSWNNFPKNYGGPGATNGQFGGGSQSMPGMRLTNGPDNKPMWTRPQDESSWSSQGMTEQKRNPKPFDPTVPSDQYTPKDGGGAGYRQERNSNPYFDNHSGRMMNLGAMQPAIGVAQAPEIKQVKPFGGSLSSDWQSYDLGTGELFGPGYQTARGGSNGSSSFDHFATNPLDVAPIAMGQRPGAFMRALTRRPSIPFGR
ncbi:MAG: hypothetical protein JSS82_15585 [Bacteroidetes bacterium]|nr:hypothetical protein [Bacteroidota bacterium]